MAAFLAFPATGGGAPAAQGDAYYIDADVDRGGLEVSMVTLGRNVTSGYVFGPLRCPDETLDFDVDAIINFAGTRLRSSGRFRNVVSRRRFEGVVAGRIFGDDSVRGHTRSTFDSKKTGACDTGPTSFELEQVGRRRWRNYTAAVRKLDENAGAGQRPAQ